MTRVLLLETFLFLLPFILFAAWRFIAHEARGREVLSDAPVLVLIATGLVLFAAGLFYIASYEKEGTDGRYVPAQFRDGKVVPGHFDHDAPPPQGTAPSGARQ